MPPAINTLNTYILPPLPQLDLPPLPVISDTKLREMVFTHTSAQNVPKRYGTSMSLMEGQMGASYEKLEFIGDSILEMVLATLTHELYPNFLQGSATVLRSYLAANATLARIAVQYGLQNNIICESSLRHVIKKSEKVQGSLLEAYIAGLYYSLLGHKDDDTPKSTQSVVSAEAGNATELTNEEDLSIPVDPINVPKSQDEQAQPNNSSPSNTDTESEKYTDQSEDEDSNMYEGIEIIFRESSDESTTSIPSSESSSGSTSPSSDDSPSSTSSSSDTTPESSSSTTIKPHKTRGEAFDSIYDWLQQVFTPVVHFAVDQFKNEEVRLSSLGKLLPYTIPPEWMEEDLKARGGKATLNNVHGLKENPVYKVTRAEGSPNTAPWKVICQVIDIDEKEWTSEVIRMTKQAGMNAAAWKICVQMGIIKEED